MRSPPSMPGCPTISASSTSVGYARLTRSGRYRLDGGPPPRVVAQQGLVERFSKLIVRATSFRPPTMSAATMTSAHEGTTISRSG